MKNFKELFSCQLLSKSLLSARPFNFFYEDSSDGELGDHGATEMTREAVSANSDCSGDIRRNESPVHPDPVSAEIYQPAQCSTDNKKTDPLTRVEALQINFLRLVHRIGQSPANPVVPQVLYRLQLANLIRAGESGAERPTLKIERARAIASELESTTQADLNFSIKILVLGKTGVGKSATINSMFDQSVVSTNAFQPATNRIQEVTGTIKGIRVTVIDTPGLSPSCQNQRKNRKILFQVKRFLRKSPPDVVLYFERLDVINRGYSDYPLLKLITDVFGASIWFNAIVVMTHASSLPPEGPDGYPVSYESFVGQCTNLLQHYIQQALQNAQLQNPVLLVENHHMCQRNAKGEKILPSGQVWMSQFLLLCIANKVLGDANTLLRFQDSFQITKARTKSPSLPHLLSSLLHPRHSSDDEFDEDSDGDEDDEYDQLPPIRILTKAQYQKLSKEQRKAYLDELDYRETLYLKKQWKAELRREREYKDDDEYMNDASQEVVQLPDVAVPLSFDPDCPGYRYRCLMGSSNQWVTRPVLDSQGWDHDVGFDGISLEASQELKRNIKVSGVGQMSKDKKDFSIQSECAAKYTDRKGRSVLTGIDIQGVGKDLVCTVRGDAKLRNLGCNVTGGGLALTSFGKMFFVGAKIQDSLSVGRRFRLMANAGRLSGQGHVANGGTLEATVRGRHYPVRDDNVKLAATILSLDREMVLGGSLESDFRVSRGGKMSVNASLNSRRLGQVSLKFNTSEHIEIGFIGAISLLQAVFRGRRTSDVLE